METINRLYTASTQVSELEVVPIRPSLNLNWKKLSSGAAMHLLPVALILAVCSGAGQALALQKGSNGPEVTNIQRCLQKLGYFNGPVNGNYGSLTQNAVTRFQQANRLPAIGSVGPQTQRLLQSECHSRTTGSSSSSSQDLRVGSSGQTVTALQQDLQQLGLFNGPITGYFGSETQQAVIRFQQFYGIRADGVVGERTLETIRISLDDQNQNQYGGGGDSLPNALNSGDRSPQVRELQESLRQLGYFTPNPSGYFGPTTRDAVARFQQAYGITPNGIADARTLIAISNALQSPDQSQTYGCNTAYGDICQGERSQRVSAVQQRLQDRGFFNGNITGYFGPATRDAVAQFQRYYRINPTGFVNYETLQALQLGNLGNYPGENPGYGNYPGENPASNRYVVVVPVRNDDTLYRVRQFAPVAFPAKSRLGAYVNAGQFHDRSDAERLSGLLRSRGLDARVDYF